MGIKSWNPMDPIKRSPLSPAIPSISHFTFAEGRLAHGVSLRYHGPRLVGRAAGRRGQSVVVGHWRHWCDWQLHGFVGLIGFPLEEFNQAATLAWLSCEQVHPSWMNG